MIEGICISIGVYTMSRYMYRRYFIHGMRYMVDDRYMIHDNNRYNIDSIIYNRCRRIKIEEGGMNIEREFDSVDSMYRCMVSTHDDGIDMRGMICVVCKDDSINIYCDMYDNGEVYKQILGNIPYVNLCDMSMMYQSFIDGGVLMCSMKCTLDGYIRVIYTIDDRMLDEFVKKIVSGLYNAR